MRIIKEERKGFLSHIHVKCNMCNETCIIPTCKESNDDINKDAVLGVMSIGSGLSHLQQISASLDIPCMSGRMYSTVHDEISNVWEETSIKAMKDAADEEKALAIAAGDINESGIPTITVVADGSWAKRSYGNRYNSLSGAAAIVGYRTKKVLFIGVRNKFCLVCDSKRKENSTPKDHKCYKNWTGSAASMEANIIAEGFQRSIEMYGLIYNRLIADGDSNTYKRILEVHPYENIRVKKIECKNHLLRNYSKKIRDLVKDTQAGPLNLRKIIEQNQLRLRWAITKAISHRKNENGSLDQKIINLKRDMNNSISHVFDEHRECQDLGYFCYKAYNENNVLNDLKSTDLYQKLCTFKNYLVRHAESLIHDVENNSVEQFNSVIAKFIGGKRVNYCQRRSYQSRCAAAVVSHNTKRVIYTARKHLSPGKSPSKFSKKMELRRTEKNRNRKPACRKPLFSKKNTETEDNKSYGEKCEKPDMTDEELRHAKNDFKESLCRSSEDIKTIEVLTRQQQNSDLWYLERRKRLTASMFGVVCRRRPTTGCKSLVQSILYPKKFYSAACDYGNKYESVARNALEKLIGKKIEPCGLFIDQEQQFLAASPDGIIEEKGIVEIKCPYSATEMTPEEGIIKRKITFWDKNGVINKKHKWFYQVQGQLHVAKRLYCVFAVWTPHGLKTETILADESFWSHEMQDYLVDFFDNCLLPEIVDSRVARNMPIRDIKKQVIKRPVETPLPPKHF
ncbi:unnamed protein product [Ceutorhynchus assimilis]|uniref:YqaJ viral recombinase domain-containing protein n=1 Tax=Ceutorhynchus assimilis TaxID=467358 RepID=A0A9N9MJI0_9CUCU|nr:unnamed protein product [Ceutorhynchus assimilis]